MNSLIETQREMAAELYAPQLQSGSRANETVATSSSSDDYFANMLALFGRGPHAANDRGTASTTASAATSPVTTQTSDFSTPDLESLLSRLGGSSSTQDSSPTQADTSTSRSDLHSTLLQDMNAIAAALTNIAAGAQTQSTAGTSPAQATSGIDTTNAGTGSFVPMWQSDWTAGLPSGDSWRQQAGMAAYTSNSMPIPANVTPATHQAVMA